MRLRHPLSLVLAAGALAAAACAHVEGPPGGEIDKEAPVLETTRPDTFAALRSYVGPVIFSFDEGLSEKGVDTVVTVSPRTSAWSPRRAATRCAWSCAAGGSPTASTR